MTFRASFATCLDVASVVEDPVTLLKNIRSLLKEGALLLVNFQSMGDDTRRDGRLVASQEGEWENREQDGVRYKFFTIPGMKKVIDNSGSWDTVEMDQPEVEHPAHLHRPKEHTHRYGAFILQAV